MKCSGLPVKTQFVVLWSCTLDLGYLIEQNQTKFPSNLIEHNRSIEFDCVWQSNKIEHRTFFVSLITSNFVRKPIKNLRLNCYEYKTISFKGTFNRTGNYSILYCNTSDINNNYCFLYSHSTIWSVIIMSSAHQSSL